MNQNKSFILYCFSTLSSIFSITTALLNILVYAIFSLSEIIFDTYNSQIYFIPHILTILFIYSIKIIISGTSFKILERLTKVIGISRNQKSKLNSIVRPISINRSLIINSSNIVNSIVIACCPTIIMPYKLLIVSLTFLFIINESYIFRIFDTLTIEILSLLVISICTILINKNITYNLIIMIISYFNLSSLIWTTSNLNYKNKPVFISHGFDGKNILKRVKYLINSSLIQLKEIPKNLKSYQIIEINKFTEEYHKLLDKLSGYIKHNDSKILVVTEESTNYNNFWSGCTDFICGLDYIISNDGNNLYPSIYEEWYQGSLYPKINRDLDKQSIDIPKEYDNSIIICNDNEIINKLSKINIEEIFIPKDLKMTLPKNTKIFWTN
tara:strand:+ start:7322 stop:8470 length:1149 start_codon:yes stop_codon:yes gene_type:complete